MAGIKRCYEVYIEEGRAKRYYRDTWAVSREKAVNNCRHRYCLATFGQEVQESQLRDNGIIFIAKLVKPAPKPLPRILQPLLPGFSDNLAPFLV